MTGTPFDVVPRMMIESVDSFALLAVPFFVLAGNLLNISGITERIFNFARDLFGWMRGGLAQVTIAAEMIFSGISGAALADLAGLGVVVIKAMRDQRYPVPFAAAVMLAACVLGPIIPPSIVFVIYGLATDTSVGRLFLAGIVPGVVIGILLMIHISIYMRIKKPDWGKPEPFAARKAWKSFKEGAFALLSPFVIIGAILSGVATPSEIGAIAAGYALLVGFAYRGLSVRGLIDCVKESVIVTAVIMYLIAVSSVMGWIVTTERIAHDAAQFIAANVHSPVLGLIVINILLLVVGTFLETVPALLILSPDPASGGQRPWRRSGPFRGDHLLQPDPRHHSPALGDRPVRCGAGCPDHTRAGSERDLAILHPAVRRPADCLRGAGAQPLASEHRLCVARIEVREGRCVV